MKIIITYDLKNGEGTDYQDILKIIREDYNGKKLTESTYECNVGNRDTFITAIKAVTKTKDRIIIAYPVYVKDGKRVYQTDLADISIVKI